MIDISHLEIVDAHSHGLPLGIVKANEPRGLIDRCTITGMCIKSSQFAERVPSAFVSHLTASTPFALRLVRELAVFLECAPDIDSVISARSLRLQEDGATYLRSLLKHAGISALIVDTGYPQPPVKSDTLEQDYAVPIGAVVRIEPIIAKCLETANSWTDLHDGFVQLLKHEVADRAVAVKSIIAYRSGLDVIWPGAADLTSRFQTWRAEGFANGRGAGKPIRDALMYVTADIAREAGIPIHIHCGGGDADVLLDESRPAKLFQFLKDRFDQDVVLIHSGWPWTEEAAFIASVLPNVYLETSLATPWASLALETKLKALMGIAPTQKIMYGSDASSEPEILWFSARVMRHVLQRVMKDASSEGWLTDHEAIGIAREVLSGNARRLHNLER